MTTHVFVPALDTFQRHELKTIADVEDLRIHPLLDMASLISASTYDFDELLERARRELAEYDQVDAIIPHWDFPTSVLGPMLSHEHGIPAPSLESLLACEHKYWSRRAQAEVAPECVPQFTVFDPEDDDALEAIDLPFPFWVKPVKGHSSQLSFKVDNAEEFHEARTAIRDAPDRIASAFDQAMEHAQLPPEIQGVSARMCLAEQLISGVQGAPEGSMAGGNFAIHGVFDMPMVARGSFGRLDYPSSLPDHVQERMADVCERYLRHVGFDNGCFNVEFMWEEDDDQLWIIEVNTRISQSHSDLFTKVDGRSNHLIALDVATGRPPRLPDEKGPFAVAAKILVDRERDGIVTKVPTEDEIVQLNEEFPDTEVRLEVQKGDRLGELDHQDPNRFVLAEVYLGAEDRDALERGYERCHELLTFEFEEVPGA